MTLLLVFYLAQRLQKNIRDNYKRRVLYTRTYACGLSNYGWQTQQWGTKK